MATYPSFILPKIAHNYGSQIVGNSVFLKAVDTGDEHVNGIAPGMWLKNGTNGPIAVVSGDNTVDWVVQTIRDSQMRMLPEQYLTADQLNATGAIYYLECLPILQGGGLVFEICEDALVTPITNANAGPGIYADIIVAAPTSNEPTSGVANPFGLAYFSILVDSNTVSSSAGSLTVQLLGLAPDITNNPYSATAGASPRKFLCKVRANT